MKEPEIIETIAPVVKAFEELGIRYYITGSVASSIYGRPRSTVDIDMVADIIFIKVHPLVAILCASFYIDEKMILEAIQRHSSFNLIHLETMLKIDIFVAENSSFEQGTFERRKHDFLELNKTSHRFYIASAEDVILNKLRWFKSGGGVARQQWNDVLSILRVQKNSVDLEYLQRWAKNLKIYNLLEKAIQEAGIQELP